MKIPKSLKAIDESSHGTYSTYFNLHNGIGIKLLNCACEEAFAEKEAKLLKQAEPSSITPKCYGYYEFTYYPLRNRKPVKRWGIIMEHIDGEPLREINLKMGKTDWDDADTKWGVPRKIRAKLMQTLRKFKLWHKDIHSGNVIFTPENEYKVIDFTPKYIKCLA